MRRLYPPVDADTQARWDAAYARARDPRRVGETMGGSGSRGTGEPVTGRTAR